ncbi:MAG: NAD(P)-dependent oxidoreductase [Alphaproteobacteria bacterium]|nr:NAD(P)-dependent oxidoreductase [Alphaproteobacteria bacterium]
MGQGGPQKAPRIGFIGVGMMGHGMARNLATKGFALAILGHRNRQPVEDLLALGAEEARNPAALAQDADIIVLCVTGTPQVEDIVYGAYGLLEAARPDQVVIDCSTSEPDSTARIFADFALRDVPFVDAPLARGPKEAEEGRLNVMVGAETPVLERIRPVLAAFAENIFHVGGPGEGHKLKLINNFFVLGQAALLAEALIAGKRAGVDLEALYRVMSAGGANSNYLRLVMPEAIKGDYGSMQFLLELARKDLRYYTHMTESLGLPGPLGEAVHQAFVQAAALGLGKKMVPSLIEAQEKLTGVKLASG